MISEINTAVDWIASWLLRDGSISEAQIERFKNQLRTILMKKYTGHWYEQTPWRGQAFRSIMHNPCCSLDSVLYEASTQTSIPNLHKYLPNESFHLWVDPGEVELRFDDSRRSEVLYRKHESSGSVPQFKVPSTHIFASAESAAPLQKKVGSTSPQPSITQPVHKPQHIVNAPQPQQQQQKYSPSRHPTSQKQSQMRPMAVFPKQTNLNYHAPPFMIKAK